jgi:catechol 2,3-dioxygenase-like lactoylglutathione lyase family enzyme
MIDHTGVSVTDINRSKAFYRAALGPLGYPPKPDFWIGQSKPDMPAIHVAFRASNRQEVDAFYRAALAAGGRDNGPPGLRPHYHANYYGAFVLDPDGHNIEAVCHTPG